MARWMLSAAVWGQGGCFLREFGDKKLAEPNFNLVSSPSRLTRVAQHRQQGRRHFSNVPLGLCLQEDIMLLSGHKCNTRLFHRKWSTPELSVRARQCCQKGVRPPPARTSPSHLHPSALWAVFETPSSSTLPARQCGCLTSTLLPAGARPSDAGGSRAGPGHRRAGAPRCAQAGGAAPAAPGFPHPGPGGPARLCECPCESPGPCTPCTQVSAGPYSAALL